MAEEEKGKNEMTFLTFKDILDEFSQQPLGWEKRRVDGQFKYHDRTWKIKAYTISRGVGIAPLIRIDIEQGNEERDG
jgi:hypothetical protein